MYFSKLCELVNYATQSGNNFATIAAAPRRARHYLFEFIKSPTSYVNASFPSTYYILLHVISAFYVGPSTRFKIILLDFHCVCVYPYRMSEKRERGRVGFVSNLGDHRSVK